MSDEKSDEEFLIRYLWHHRVPCPRCRRELFGLTEGTCPNCRERLRIGVGMAQPHLRGWLALAIPLIGSAGIGLLFAILMAGRGGMPPMYPLMLFSMIYFWTAIPLSAVVLIGRRRVMKWSGAVQAIAATAAWTLGIVALIVMFIRRF